MYIGTHYNSYYNSLFGAKVSTGYGQTGKVGQSMFYPSSTNVYNQSAFGSSALKYVQNIKSASAGLKSSLNSLSGGSAFRKLGPVSSDTESVEVKDTVAAFRSGEMAASISVDKIATAQKNEGDALQAKAAAGMSGYMQFAMEVNGKVHQFSFEAKSTDTNEQIQQKMALAINDRGIGVTASVSEKAGMSTLSLESNKTGLFQGTFEIRDVAGGAAKALGVLGATQNAQDASYRLNGGELKTSASNTVDIGGGVSAVLKKATEEPVKISRGVDSSFAVSKIKSMVDSYNSLYGESLENTEDSRASNLFNKLIGVSRTYTNSLAEVGIGFDSNGFMKIDEKQMAKAADSGKLESFFTENAGKSYGFTNQLSRVADDVQRNTNRYVSQSSFLKQSTGSSGLSSIMGNSAATLLNSLASTGGNSGWMFDFLL